MEENQKIELEISKLVLETYNRIALWNNNDYDTTRQKGDALKLVSHDIVQNILEELAGNLGLKSNTIVSRGDIKVGDIQSVKDQDSFNQANEEDIFNKLFIDKSKP